MKLNGKKISPLAAIVLIALAAVWDYFTGGGLFQKEESPPELGDLRPQPGREVQSFYSAKKDMMEVYSDNRRTFYCDCAFDADKQVDARSCGLQARKNETRAKRVEWEHVVPAWNFGHRMQCWQEGGREQCEGEDLFKMMESDMHNLVPAVGELNGDRSNFRLGMLQGEPRAYGACDFEVDFQQRRAEPREAVRGDVARAYLYMEYQYGQTLSDSDKKLYEAWHRQDPVDDWERQRHERVAKIQGNRNPFVDGTQ